MARLPRICLPGIPQHVIQRGNDRHACFASEEDFVAYAHWLGEFSRKYRVAIHAWVRAVAYFLRIHYTVLTDTKPYGQGSEGMLVGFFSDNVGFLGLRSCACL
jgi:hypothetical protein